MKEQQKTYTASEVEALLAASKAGASPVAPSSDPGTLATLAEARAVREAAEKAHAEREIARLSGKATGSTGKAIDKYKGGVEYALTEDAINGAGLVAKIHFGIPDGMRRSASGALYLFQGIQGHVFKCPSFPLAGELAGKDVRLSFVNGSAYCMEVRK